jgi:hypothetical protein
VRECCMPALSRVVRKIRWGMQLGEVASRDGERGAMVGRCAHTHKADPHPPPPPLQASPARALEWEVPLEELRPMVAEVASGESEKGGVTSPGAIVSHGLEWRLQVLASAPAAAAAPAAATRPVQLGLFIMNSVRFAVPSPPAACTLTGLSCRLEAARAAQPAGDAGAVAGGRQGQRAGAAAPLGPLSKEMSVSDISEHNRGLGWPTIFPDLASGSVDDPALAPFVHTGPGGAKVLRLRVEGLGLE